MAEHDPAPVLAYLRCADQHPERHDQGGVGTCAACTSWGEHAADAVAPAIREAALNEAADRGPSSTSTDQLWQMFLRDMAAQQREEQADGC